MTENAAERQSCVAVISDSPVLSSFIAENVLRAGFLPALLPDKNAGGAEPFSDENITPCFVFVDFAADISIADISRRFPAAGIAVLAGVRDMPLMEKQLDMYPYFRFVEKPCSESDIREALVAR